MREKKSTWWIIPVLLLILIAACVAVVTLGVYTNGYESMKTHYVTIDGNVVNNLRSIRLSTDGDTVFKLKGAGFKAAEWGDYTVKIEANSNSGVAFNVDGEPYKYADIDFTELFSIKTADNELTIESGNYGVKYLLDKMYSGADVTAEAKAPPYVMTITPSSGVAFKVFLDYAVEPEGMELSPSDIVAG